ncbi:hypothetical protein Tco_0046504 [Tanacetum coccineum]
MHTCRNDRIDMHVITVIVSSALRFTSVACLINISAICDTKIILGSCLAMEVFLFCDLDINAAEFDAILVLDHADLFFIWCSVYLGGAEGIGVQAAFVDPIIDIYSWCSTDVEILSSRPNFLRDNHLVFEYGLREYRSYYKQFGYDTWIGEWNLSWSIRRIGMDSLECTLEGIRRIGNWSNAFSCEVQALICRISFVGYGKLRQKGVYEESFSRHAAWIGGKLIQFMHTTMVPVQVKTMKIQAGIQVSRPRELTRQLQLWKFHVVGAYKYIRSFDLNILGSCLAMEVFLFCDLDINAAEFDAILVLDHADLLSGVRLSEGAEGIGVQQGDFKHVLTFRDYHSGVESGFAEYRSYYKQFGYDTWIGEWNLSWRASKPSFLQDLAHLSDLYFQVDSAINLVSDSSMFGLRSGYEEFPLFHW